MRPLLILLPLLLTACAAPPRAGDPTIPSQQVRTDFFAAPQVRLHRYSAKDSRMPDAAFSAAIATIERHLGRTIQVIDHGEMENGWGKGGPIAPIQDQGHPVSAADVAGGTYLLHEPDHGILGVIAMRAIPGEEAAFGADPGPMLALVEPGTIIVVELPGPDDGRGVTGHTGPVATPGPQRCSGAIVLERSVIHRRSNMFVSESKLFQWTLTHEIGHVLGVPASNTHVWSVPGLGPHCTHPECVMYTGVDWRVFVTGLLKGWPLDFCEKCGAELAEARGKAGVMK